MDLLCEFARCFPFFVAEILDRDQHKSRNFREETITDVLMAGLIGFEPFGIYVDFPADESKTGEDMDWEFVDPDALDGRRYLRLHIQAKRAIESTGKSSRSWFYRELDHAAPKKAPRGSQHKHLLEQASATAGCVPLYIFYHPLKALDPAKHGVPSIEGVNLMFADRIEKKLTPKRWPIADKRVSRWRRNFMSLSSVLCFGHGPFLFRTRKDVIGFLMSRDSDVVPSPGAIVDRLNQMRRSGSDGPELPFEAVEEIPELTLRAVEEHRSRTFGIGRERRTQMVDRPRVLFDARSRTTEGA